MEILKNRNTQIALGVILIVVLGLGAYFLFAGSSKNASEDDQAASESMVQTVSADEIGLTLEVSDDKKQVKFKIAEAKGIESIEYEMTYEADASAAERSEGGEDRVQRGITGEAEVNPGESAYESEWLDLGSCSRNICKYDTGVDAIDITLKITKEDGSIIQVEDTIEI